MSRKEGSGLYYRKPLWHAGDEEKEPHPWSKHIPKRIQKQILESHKKGYKMLKKEKCKLITNK